jgi:hypothetical protein
LREKDAAAPFFWNIHYNIGLFPEYPPFPQGPQPGQPVFSRELKQTARGRRNRSSATGRGARPKAFFGRPAAGNRKKDLTNLFVIDIISVAIGDL